MGIYIYVYMCVSVYVCDIYMKTCNPSTREIKSEETPELVSQPI